MSIRNHTLANAEFIPSPNKDERPPHCSISLIVIHCISLPAGHFGGNYVTDLFTNQLDTSRHSDFEDLQHTKVSTHVFLKRDGYIMQFVPFNQRAWHAGESEYEGKQNCNDFSIGIELEGVDSGFFTEVQYRMLADVCSALISEYGENLAGHIVGHSDIAPLRKTDPGSAFDWIFFRSLLASVVY